jgi:hypothetical protein
MIIMVEGTYPGTKMVEVANAFLERLKDVPLPDYVKILEGYALAGGDGIRALVFYEVDDGNSKEGRDFISKAVLYLLQKVDGYKSEILTVAPLAEAFQLIDMQLPAV